MNNKELQSKLDGTVGAAFLLTAIYFIWTNSGFFSLFSFKHLAFILIGAAVFGFILSSLLYITLKFLLKISNYINNKFSKYSPFNKTLNLASPFGIPTEILIYVLVFFITKNLYVYFFTTEYEIKHPPLMRSFHCTQFKNEFTLGKYSNPTNKQIEDLCICIDNKLTEADKSNLNSNVNQIGSENLIKSIKNFGDSLKQCGGHDL